MCVLPVISAVCLNELRVPQTFGILSLYQVGAIAVLQDMGFIDRAENIRALQAVNGNVNAAVERLLSGV